MDVISWWCQLRTRQGLDGREQLPVDWERTDSLKESRRVRRGWREWRSSVPVQVIKEQGSCSNHSGIRLLETMKMWERLWGDCQWFLLWECWLRCIQEVRRSCIWEESWRIFFKYLQLTGALAAAELEMSRGLIIFSVSVVGLLLLSGSKRAPNPSRMENSWFYSFDS